MSDEEDDLILSELPDEELPELDSLLSRLCLRSCFLVSSLRAVPLHTRWIGTNAQCIHIHRLYAQDGSSAHLML